MSDWIHEDEYDEDHQVDLKLNQKVLESVYSSMEGRIVSNAVVVVETIEPDGSRAMWVIREKTTPTWVTLGLLYFAVEIV